jgi:anti-sigma factor RsiW
MPDTWTDRLSEYIDDELTPDERTALEGHLAGCDACARLLDELRLVVDRAAAAPALPPASDLWPEIAARLATARHSGLAGASPARRIAFTAPQLAAAALLVALLSGWMVWTATSRPAPPGAVDGVAAEGAAAPTLSPAQYDQAVAELERTLALGRDRLDAATVAVVEENLAIIDRAIEEARRALNEDPSNSYVSGHLAQVRRQKLELLRYAAALPVDGN